MKTIQHMTDIRQDCLALQASFARDSSADSSPSVHGKCLDPANCALRAQRYRKSQQSVLPVALAQHEALLTYFPHAITLSEHAEQRLWERGIVWRDILAVVESCEPIEWHDTSKQLEDIRRLGYGYTRLLNRFGLGRYEIKIRGETTDRQPLIVVCSYGDRPTADQVWTLTITTAFNPAKVRPYQWSSDYTRRICFCPPPTQTECCKSIKAMMLLQGARTHPQDLQGPGGDGYSRVVYTTET